MGRAGKLAGVSADRWFVLKAEPCDMCDGKGHNEVIVPGVGWYDDDCVTCNGTGYWFDVSSAIPVEPDYGYGDNVRFVPVSSTEEPA